MSGGTDVYLGNSEWAVRTQLTGSSVPEAQALPTRRQGKFVTETILNAVSVGANAIHPATDLNITTESELWVLVNIDQQPWSLYGSYAAMVIGADKKVYYPKYDGSTVIYTNSAAPAVALYLGQMVDASVGLTAPTTMRDAKDFIIYNDSGKVRIGNQSANTATVTFRVIRVWR